MAATPLSFVILEVGAFLDMLIIVGSSGLSAEIFGPVRPAFPIEG